MKEMWRIAPGTEDRYEVSNLGRVRNRVTKHIKAQTRTKPGYRCVQVYYGRMMHRVKVHRLVGLAWVPNPNNLNELNHIDENKDNNRADNLEWCTHHYNSNYGHRNARIRAHWRNQHGGWDDGRYKNKKR